MKEVEEVINQLKNGNPAVQKKTTFDLSKKYLQDLDFAREFLVRDGISATFALVKNSTGGTLAHALLALESAMSYGYQDVIGEDLVERIVECVLDSTNIQVKSNSLKICAHLIGNKKSGGFWLVHRELVRAARKREQQPYEAIISALKNEDLNIKVGALQVINSFIEHSPDKSTFEDFLVLIENFGYLEELKAQLVTVKSLDFRKAVYWHQVAKSDYWGQEKTIPYDKENPDHEACLMELWNTCFPSTNLESRVSEQWKLLGFQGTDPATDFRGMGLLGLKHILYFAKNYTPTFVEMAKIQAGRDNHYYPVSTAGINISSILLELLNIGKKVEDGEIFPILFDHHHALEEMYCIVFQLFNRVWDEMNADYMDFKMVADAVKEATVAALKESNDLETFRRVLKVPFLPTNRGKEEERVSRLLDMEGVESKIAAINLQAKKAFRRSVNPSSTHRTPSQIQLTRSTSPSPISPSQRQTAPANLTSKVPSTLESLSLSSENVTLDIYVALANQCTQITVPRDLSVKAVIEQTTKLMKKKMKKGKKGEVYQLYLPATGIWLDDSRKIFSYLLKDSEKLELKAKPIGLLFRKVDIEINLESTSYVEHLEFLPETTVRGIIQLIDKNKNIVQDIHLYGLFLGGDGSHLWLDESRSFASYGMSKSKLVFSLRSTAIGGNVTKQQTILLQIQFESNTKTMQFDEVLAQ